MKLSRKFNDLVKNIGLMTIGNFASRIMSFVLIPIYTSQLSTSEYGTADLIFTTLSLLVPILSLEINEAVLRFSLSKSRKENYSVFTIGVAVSCLSVVLFFLVFPFFYYFGIFRNYCVLIIALYISNLIYVCMSQYAKGNKYVKEYSICGFVSTTVVALLNVLFLVVFNLKVEGYLLSYILGYFAASVYLFFSVRSSFRLISFKKIKRREIRQMFCYSIPLIPNAICWWINNASDKYILGYFSDTSAVGLYSISYKIPSLLSSVAAIFFSAWQISAVEDYGKKECEEFYSKIYRIFFVMNASICVLLIVNAEFFAQILYAKDFYVAWKYSVVLISAYFINALSTFIGTIYTTSKKTKMLLVSSVLAAFINILFNFILIPTYGAYGAAVATLISYVVVFCVRVYDTKTILALKYNKMECVFFFMSMLSVMCAMLFVDGLLRRLICWGITFVVVIYVMCVSFKAIKGNKKWNKM